MTRARRMLIGGFSVTIAVGPARSPAQSPARTQPAVVITHPAQRPTLASRTVHLIRRDPVIAVPLDSVRNIRLAPGEFLGQRTGYGSHVELREQQLGMVGGGVPRVVTVRPLPFIYTATTIDGKRVRLQPAVVSEGLGYVRDSNSFVDSMLIALEDRDSPGDNEVLSGPIRINLSSQGHIVSPDTVDVTRTNLPPVRVRVRAGVAVDSVSIRVIPTFDPRGEYGWLAVRPAILFHNVRRRAVGLGVAIVPVQMAITGRTYRDSVRVLVSTDMGSLDRNEVMIPPGGSATVHLRTEGSDSATVSASSPGISDAHETIEFEWPFAFLAFALVGGGVGGLAAQLSRRGRGRRALVRATWVGAVIGFTAAIVYAALGVSLIAMQMPAFRTDEAADFAFALLGAALGIPAFVRTRNFVRGAKTPRGATESPTPEG